MPVHPERGAVDGNIFVVDGFEDGCWSSFVLNCQQCRLSVCRSFTMPTIERNDQPGDQTKDEKGSPSSAESNNSKAETKPIKPPRKVAVKKKTARKKAAKTAGSRMEPAKTDTSQTRREEIQKEESNSSKAESKPIKPPRKVAVKKKTARKKTAKTAVNHMEPAKTDTSQTRHEEIQNEESNSGKAESKPIKPPRKVAVKKKTVRKKAAKTAVGHMDSAKLDTPQTTATEIKLERPSVPDQAASATGSEAGKAPPAEQSRPEKPVEVSVSPAAAPLPPSQPRPPGGTGLRGFWIKVGTSAFVILAGITGIYSFFSEDEATSTPQATQAAAASAPQSDDAPVADSGVADTGMARGVVFPPATEQSNVVDPESLRGYSNQPETFAGAAVANEPVVDTANTAGGTRGVTPAADQSLAIQRHTAPAAPHSGHFSEEPVEYRPELYRPLESEQEPPPSTQASAVSEAPRTSFVPPAPSYYPQPGAYAYPPAPYYGGYGRYYPY